MKTPIFSIPFNGDLALTRWAIGSGQVKEVYFASPSKPDLSLACDRSPYLYDETTIHKLLWLCRRKKIEANLLVNQISLMHTDMVACLKYIRKLPFLSSITVGDPYAVDFFQSNFPGLDIQASIIMNLYSANRIENLLKKGVGTVSLPYEYARDRKGLKNVNALKRKYKKFKIKLFVSNVCFHDCPFTLSHFAIRFNRALKPPSGRTLSRYLKKDVCEIAPDGASLIRRPFVRPEDINTLLETGHVDYLKLIYRFDSSEVLYKKFKAYFDRTFTGDLFEIIPYPGAGGSRHRITCDNSRFPAGFYKRVFGCEKKCYQCDYCLNTAKKVLSGAVRSLQNAPI